MAGVSRLKAGTAEKLSEAVASNVADIDMWAAHTHQVVALLLQIQRAGEEKEKAWAHERAATAAATLAAARGAKLENALHAGIVAAAQGGPKLRIVAHYKSGFLSSFQLLAAVCCTPLSVTSTHNATGTGAASWRACRQHPRPPPALHLHRRRMPELELGHLAAFLQSL